MNKQRFKTASFILLIAYAAFCFFDITICLIYRMNFDSAFGHKCAYLALYLTGALFLVPAMPIGLALNILAMPETNRKCWLIWTIVSPAVYLACFFVTLIVFVATTGGV